MRRWAQPVMGRLEGVDTRIGQTIIESARAEIVGLELEGLTIGLHRLFELAGIEPVPPQCGQRSTSRSGRRNGSTQARLRGTAGDSRRRRYFAMHLRRQ